MTILGALVTGFNAYLIYSIFEMKWKIKDMEEEMMKRSMDEL